MIGLGTNQGDRTSNLREALNQLNAVNYLKVSQVSPIYRSDALLPEHAPKNWDQFYLNVNILCETSLSPHQLLNSLQKIEHKMGRDKREHTWGPRIIDLDILVWKNCVLNSRQLTVPHSELAKRPFVLWPLIDLLPDWQDYMSDPNIIKAILFNLQLWDKMCEKNSPFNTKKLNHRIDVPHLMGILNVTPDSFSELPGLQTVDSYLNKAINMFDAGAEIIDVGAESTRPKSLPISKQEEWKRLQPVLQAMDSHWQGSIWKPKISIDTRNSEVAEKAVTMGIDYLNDVSGFESPRMSCIAAKANVYAICMHHCGVPPNKKNIIPYSKDPILEILNWAKNKKKDLLNSGVALNKIIFDPGIGYGKNTTQNWQILKRINELHAVGVPLLVGHSRKSFLNSCTEQAFKDKDYETAVVSEFLARNKVQYLRVHDVEHNVRNLRAQTFLL